MKPFYPPNPAIDRVIATLLAGRPPAARPGTEAFRDEIDARTLVAERLHARLAQRGRSPTITLAIDEAFELLDDVYRLIDCAQLLHAIEHGRLIAQQSRLRAEVQ